MAISLLIYSDNLSGYFLHRNVEFLDFAYQFFFFPFSFIFPVVSQKCFGQFLSLFQLSSKGTFLLCSDPIYIVFEESGHQA